ncbi:hypothetical protein CVT25_004680 [Psilocybe cyanescens]|uniref:Uncharacterized protein n=1 Tax=Psilocybe cyanescens TaxID=93625 RepID=A0A409XE15_PSICY|nr:hypothetical protein CVT25_004680 [Psilocybe cyanescens]
MNEYESTQGIRDRTRNRRLGDEAFKADEMAGAGRGRSDNGHTCRQRKWGMGKKEQNKRNMNDIRQKGAYSQNYEIHIDKKHKKRK